MNEDEDNMFWCKKNCNAFDVDHLKIDFCFTKSGL